MRRPSSGESIRSTAVSGTRISGGTGTTCTTPGSGRVLAASGAPMPGRR